MASHTSSAVTSRVISHERILHYVYEFLDESGYHQTLRALQAESRVPYNTIRVRSDVFDSSTSTPHPSLSGRRNNTKGFAPATERNLEGAVLEGSWAEVLHVYVDGLLLPEEIKATLYEVILEEMVELHGLVPAARSLLLNAPIFQLMKTDTPARYIRLEKMIEQGQRTMSEEMTNTSATRLLTPEMRQRRTALLQQLKAAIRFTADAPVGRLAAALTLGAPTDVDKVTQSPEAPALVGSSRKRDRDTELSTDAPWTNAFLQYPLTAPKEIRRRLPYDGTHAACYCTPLLSAHQELLAVGCADGTVELMSLKTGEPCGNPLRHTDGVLSMASDSADGVVSAPDWLAVGYRDGWVKVYNVATHKLVRRFEKAHTMGITALLFSGPRNATFLSGHHSFIVTGSFDGAIQVLDIAAGAVSWTVANCHGSAFVHALLPLECRCTVVDTLQHCVLSSGNDGTLSVWRLEDKREGGAEVRGAMELLRIQEAIPLSQVHHELQDAVPTQLYGLHLVEGTAHGAAATSVTTGVHTSITQDALVLTRVHRACIVRITVKDEGSRYFSVSIQMLCIILTAHPLRTAFPRVHMVMSMSVPLLTLYAADDEGTISLYNIEMKWCSEEMWASFGGCIRIRSATDQSAALIVAVGKSVKDLQMTCVWPQTQHHPSSIVAYSASLPVIYELH